MVKGWIGGHAVRLDPVTYEPDAKDAARLARLDAALGEAKVVFLGETNHFVHEKADFRLWWLRRLAGRRPLVVGEELSWSDGHHVWRYLRTGDPAHLDQAATFGGTGYRRADRDDQPTGISKASYDAYPTALFKAEQARFYHGLRALPGIRRFFGFDIDAPGAGYLDLRRHAHNDPSFWRRLQRVRGESITDEADRLEHALTMLPDDDSELRADLAATITSLRYTQMANDAADYEAARLAAAVRPARTRLTCHPAPAARKGASPGAVGAGAVPGIPGSTATRRKPLNQTARSKTGTTQSVTAWPTPLNHRGQPADRGRTERRDPIGLWSPETL